MTTRTRSTLETRSGPSRGLGHPSALSSPSWRGYSSACGRARRQRLARSTVKDEPDWLANRTREPPFHGPPHVIPNTKQERWRRLFAVRADTALARGAGGFVFRLSYLGRTAVSAGCLPDAPVLSTKVGSRQFMICPEREAKSSGFWYRTRSADPWTAAIEANAAPEWLRPAFAGAVKAFEALDDELTDQGARLDDEARGRVRLAAQPSGEAARLAALEQRPANDVMLSGHPVAETPRNEDGSPQPSPSPSSATAGWDASQLHGTPRPSTGSSAAARKVAGSTTLGVIAVGLFVAGFLVWIVAQWLHPGDPSAGSGLVVGSAVIVSFLALIAKASEERAVSKHACRWWQFHTAPSRHETCPACREDAGRLAPWQPVGAMIVNVADRYVGPKRYRVRNEHRLHDFACGHCGTVNRFELMANGTWMNVVPLFAPPKDRRPH